MTFTLALEYIKLQRLDRLAEVSFLRDDHRLSERLANQLI
jgi:hypothetical protein